MVPVGLPVETGSPWVPEPLLGTGMAHDNQDSRACEQTQSGRHVGVPSCWLSLLREREVGSAAAHEDGDRHLRTEGEGTAGWTGRRAGGREKQHARPAEG